MDPAPPTWAPPGQRSHSGSSVKDAVRKFVLFFVWVFFAWMRASCGFQKVLRRPIRGLAHRNRSDFCDICDCDAHRGPQKSQRFPRQETAMMHCDLRVRWKVASDLRFQAAISEPKTSSFCGISGDLAPSTRKSLAIAIVRFWCAKSIFQPAPKYSHKRVFTHIR